MKVLFVSHMASRSGAPLLLLWLLRWLRQHAPAIKPCVALLNDGELRADFEALAPTLTWQQHLFRPLAQRLGDRLTGQRHHSRASLLTQAVATFRPDLLYLNTLVLGQHLEGVAALPDRPPCLSHGHELEITLATMSTAEDVARQLTLSSHVIACAEAVRQSLIHRHALAPERCSVIAEFIPYATADALSGNTASASSVPSDISPALRRLAAAAAHGHFVIGFAGQGIVRKGFDLFPLLVRACAEQFGSDPFLAVWLGASPGAEATVVVRRDIELMGLDSHALLVPPQPSGIEVIRHFHVHGLLSREDPYPVVALEAAALAIPTLCFRDSGGMAEFVADGSGLVIDYLDLRGFATALHQLSQDPERRHCMGEQARRKVFRDSSIEVAAPRIVARIEQVAAACKGL